MTMRGCNRIVLLALLGSFVGIFPVSGAWAGVSEIEVYAAPLNGWGPEVEACRSAGAQARCRIEVRSNTTGTQSIEIQVRVGRGDWQAYSPGSWIDGSPVVVRASSPANAGMLTLAVDDGIRTQASTSSSTSGLPGWLTHRWYSYQQWEGVPAHFGGPVWDFHNDSGRSYMVLPDCKVKASPGSQLRVLEGPTDLDRLGISAQRGWTHNPIRIKFEAQEPLENPMGLPVEDIGVFVLATDATGDKLALWSRTMYQGKLIWHPEAFAKSTDHVEDRPCGSPLQHLPSYDGR